MIRLDSEVIPVLRQTFVSFFAHHVCWIQIQDKRHAGLLQSVSVAGPTAGAGPDASRGRSRSDSGSRSREEPRE